MIDLNPVRRVLDDVQNLIDNLDGQELDETNAIVSQSRGEVRKHRAQLSQDLQLLATRLELAASLARIEYWYARGEKDPTRPDRDD